MNLSEFKKLPVLGILRGIEQKHVYPLTRAVVASGLKFIEVTMNTPGAEDMIREMVTVSAGELSVGAGTVLNLEDLNKALAAGAEFIVSPVLVEEVVVSCNELNIPVFPGALTPQEVFNAWNAGATMVKVFPTKQLGPGYIKELKGPFDQIEMMACGGVNKDTIAEFFQCGASAVGFGGSIFRKEWMVSGQYEHITAAIRELISAAQLETL